MPQVAPSPSTPAIDPHVCDLIETAQREHFTRSAMGLSCQTAGLGGCRAGGSPEQPAPCRCRSHPKRPVAGHGNSGLTCQRTNSGVGGERRRANDGAKEASMAGRRSREERETVIRFDETQDLAYLWTASPSQARVWTRAGVALTAGTGGWSGRVPKAAVRRCRKLVGGQLVKHKARGVAAGALARTVGGSNSGKPISNTPGMDSSV